MLIKKTRQSALLIDGSNLYASMKGLGFVIDYQKLLRSFDGTIFKAYYFTARAPAGEQSTLQPLIDHLDYNGFTVIQKETKEFDQIHRFNCIKCGEHNRIVTPRIKGNMDIEISVIAKEIAPYIDDLFLFSGDGDFRFLVEALQRTHGLHVTVVSTIRTNPVMCAPELRRQADSFIDLADLRDSIERDEDKRSSAKRNFMEGK